MFFQGLLQAAQFVASLNLHQALMFTAAAREAAYTSQRYYYSLTPENQEKVLDVIRWGAKQAALQAMMPGVLGLVGDQVMQIVSNQMVADIAKQAVKRAAEIGIDSALKEAQSQLSC